MTFLAITPERLGLDRGRNVRVGRFIGNDWWLIALNALPPDLQPFADDLCERKRGPEWIERIEAVRSQARPIVIRDPRMVRSVEWEYQWVAPVERTDGAPLPVAGVDPSLIAFVEAVLAGRTNSARWVWLPGPVSEAGLFAYQAPGGDLLGCVAPKAPLGACASCGLEPQLAVGAHR